MILSRRLDAQSELVCFGGRGVLRDYRGLGMGEGVLNATEFNRPFHPHDSGDGRRLCGIGEVTHSGRTEMLQRV